MNANNSSNNTLTLTTAGARGADTPAPVQRQRLTPEQLQKRLMNNVAANAVMNTRAVHAGNETNAMLISTLEKVAKAAGVDVTKEIEAARAVNEVGRANAAGAMNQLERNKVLLNKKVMKTVDNNMFYGAKLIM